MRHRQGADWRSWRGTDCCSACCCRAFLVVGWDTPEARHADVDSGWIAMALGIVVTMALGGGLMALMFYSNRHGRD